MEFVTENINLILFLPLIVCFVIGMNGLVSNRLENSTLFSISFVSSLICFVFSVFLVIFVFIDNKSLVYNYNWLSFDDIKFYFGVFIDKISVTFLLLTSVANLFVQFFAFIKMQKEYDLPRVLFYLNLFFLALNGIFLSSNIFQTYLFCELLGVASYLLVSFDFANRELSKSGIKSFIYNRIGDLTLLFVVLVIMYFAVIYNELSYQHALSYSSLPSVAVCIDSLMNTPVFVGFCSALIFAVIMKFFQAISAVLLELNLHSVLATVVIAQNSLIAFVGVYLFLRLEPFFSLLNQNWVWLFPAVILIFIFFGVLNKIFIPVSKIFLWIEKYFVETFAGLLELGFRCVSYLAKYSQSRVLYKRIVFIVLALLLVCGLLFVFYELLNGEI